MSDHKEDAVEEMVRVICEGIWDDVTKRIKGSLSQMPTFNQAVNELVSLQDKIYQDAKASNTDMEQVERLFALQWEQLLDDWSQVDEETN